MKISMEWLGDFVAADASADEIAEKLTMTGLEVEAVEKTGGDVDLLRVVEVRKIKPHPDADKLKICEVFNGENTVDVVCGAPNVAEGMLTAWAPPGTRLGKDMLIEETAIRGVRSAGMLCSLRELGIEAKSDGIHEFDSNAKVGDQAAPLLGISSDTVIDLAVTPNRGDALSVEGVAREVAAAYGKELKKASDDCPEEGVLTGDIITLRILDPIGCPRYVARVIEDIKIGPSPAWMQRRLAASGIRAINNIVDITNYVLLESGQPLHAFDMDKLSGPGIEVRRSKKGEKFVTLDGVERNLENDLLICDAEKPVALAGVMGGLNSEVTESTVNVLLESACFDPTGIRRTSKRLGLMSEASYRFERGVDPCLQLRAANRAAALMVEIAGGKVAIGALDDHVPLPQPPDMLLREDRVKLYLGVDISRDECKTLLESIGFEVKEAPEGLIVFPPTWRGDIFEEADIIEEVARLYGYDKLPVTLPEGRPEPVEKDPGEAPAFQIQEALLGAGYYEIVGLSFMNPLALDQLRLPDEDKRRRTVKLLNPLSSEESVMRTSLVPCILNTAAYNLKRLQEDVRLFEISRVFIAREGESLPEESIMVTGVMVPPHQKVLHQQDAHPFYSIKGALENVFSALKMSEIHFDSKNIEPYMLPGESTGIIISGEQVGFIGRVRPTVAESFDISVPYAVYVFELDFLQLLRLSSPVSHFEVLPVHPPAFRDIAVVVEDKVQVAELEKVIIEVNSDVVKAAKVFDIYYGKQVPEGHKSVAFSIVYQWADRSPVDEEVSELHREVTAGLEKKFGAKIR